MKEVKLFAESVAEQIKDYLPEYLKDGVCRVMEITKNNNTRLVGLNFQKPGNAIASVMYMEVFYEQMRQGKPMGRIMKDIAKYLEESMKTNEGWEVQDIKDYRLAADRLAVAAINTKANASMLSETPHEEIEDLSLICRIILRMGDDRAYGSVRVTNKMLDEWGVTKEEIFERAKENTLRDFPPELYGMETLFLQPDDMKNLLQEGMELPEDGFPMYVLANRQKNNGAGAVAFPQILERVDGLFPEGCYFIPSSVHELIVFPKDKDLLPCELGRLVRKVNRSQLSREEILSDRVYEYDKEAGKIRQIPESIEKKRDRER